MKKTLLIALAITAFLLSCSNEQREKQSLELQGPSEQTNNEADTSIDINTSRKAKWVIKEECLAAISKEKFTELNRVCSRHDQNSLMKMIASGYVRVMSVNDNIEMVDYGFAKCKIKLENGQTYYVSSDFVTH